MIRKQVLPIHSFLNEHQVFLQYPDCDALISIDEAGRGCLAGPVVAGVSLWLPEKMVTDSILASKQKHWLYFVRDSKKLSAKQREYCYELIQQAFCIKTPDVVEEAQKALHEQIPFETLELPFKRTEYTSPSLNTTTNPYNNAYNFICMHFAVGAASVKEIDELNIWNATQLAIARALKRLYQSSLLTQYTIKNPCVAMDGHQPIKLPPFLTHAKLITSIDGDQNFVSIAFSSIVAKVFRDHWMEKLDAQYPLYKLAQHKGYGTAEHRKLIQEHGPAPIHRKTFLKNTYANTH